MHRDRAISARLLHNVGIFLTAHGLDLDRLVADCGLDLEVTKDPNGEIPFADFLNFLEVASQRLGWEDLGIRLVERMPVRMTGIYHYLTTNAATLRAEAVTSCRYLGLITNAYTAAFSEDNGMGWVSFQFRNDTGSRTQFVDLQMAAVVLRIRQILQDPLLPIRVELERPKPRSIAPFERTMGTNIYFGAPHNRVGFAAQLLSRPIPGADAELFDELQRVGDLLLSLKAREDSIVETLSEFVAASLPNGGVTAQLASQFFKVSDRTLQRSLAAANTSFTKVVDDTRQRMAHHYLMDTGKPLTEVAFLLGFSELSAFSRAAKTWFGETPSSIRKRGRPTNAPTAARLPEDVDQ